MMNGKASTVSASIDLPAEPSAVFDGIVEELSHALNQLGLHFETGSEGRILQQSFEVGRVITWEPGKRIAFEWRQASWKPDEVTEIELLFDAVDGGTKLTLEHHRWGGLIGDSGEIAGWFASEIAAPFFHAMAPRALGDWMTDRKARRPSGTQSRAYYRDPLYHYPSFQVILSELALNPGDYLLEVGCGGGVLLKQAIQSGCRAVGIDHSPDMVELARDVNRDAISIHNMEILEGIAELLPFSDNTFTCAAMTGVLGFLADPVLALSEIRRVLVPGGRFVGLGTDPKLRGTPAAPEPMASRLRFYEDEELAHLARRAGFGEVRVVHRNLETFARQAGVPEEHLPLFAGDTSFLLAHNK